MTKQTEKSHRSQGPWSGVVGFLMQTIFSLVMAVVVGCCIASVGLHTLWKDEGVARSERVFKQNLAYLTMYEQGLLVQNPHQMLIETHQRLEHFLQQKGFFDWLAAAKEKDAQKNSQKEATNPSPKVSSLLEMPTKDSNINPLNVANIFQGWQAVIAPYAEIAYYVLQDVMLRLLVLVFALPTFGLAIIIGLVDGLAARDVRKWCGGRETTVYRRIKKWVWPLLMLGVSVYLGVPYAFDATLAILPIATFFLLSVSLMASKYQKYI